MTQQKRGRPASRHLQKETRRVCVEVSIRTYAHWTSRFREYNSLLVYTVEFAIHQWQYTRVTIWELPVTPIDIQHQVRLNFPIFLNLPLVFFLLESPENRNYSRDVLANVIASRKTIDTRVHLFYFKCVIR